MSSAKDKTSNTSALHEQIFNLSILLNPPAGSPQDVRVDCPFVPDEIRVECCFIGEDNGAAAIVYDPVNPTVNGNATENSQRILLYVVRSNLLSGNETIAYCNGFNTWNPKQKFYNFARQSFNSTYRMQLFRLPRNDAILIGNMFIHLEFVRYRVGDEKN